jgi:hypothetical protein
MDFLAQLDELEHEAAETKSVVLAAVTESRDQIRRRIDQLETNQSAIETPRSTGAGAGAQSKWDKMRADAAAKRDELKARIDKRNREMDAGAAETEAEWAEDDAAAAIDFAVDSVDNARLAVLDAIDARAYAEVRARSAAS